MNLLRGCVAAVLVLAASAGADSIRQVSLPANDLAYDPVSRRIYASVPSSAGSIGNSITAIDPETGKVGPSVFVGSEPGKLAPSDDDQYLYVALDGAAAVRRFNLAEQRAELQFPLGSAQLGGALTVGDMQVMPYNWQTVAVARRGNGVAIYDNGVPRTKTTSWTDRVGIIAFGRSANRLYGYDTETSGAAFLRMSVDASGLTILDTALAGGLGTEMKFADGLIYGSSGLVIDPETRQLVGTFKGPGYDSLVAPDVAAGRVYFLTGTDQQATRSLLTFDPHTFLSLGTMAVPGVKGRASSLIRWGVDGLAFRTDQGQIFLIRPSAPVPSGADLVLTATATPDPVVQGNALATTITVTNTSSSPATGVRLTESLPVRGDPIVFGSVSQGRCLEGPSSARTIVCDLGSLAGGARASVTLVVNPGAASTAGITSWTIAASVTDNETGSNPSISRVEKTVTVIPWRSSAPSAGTNVRLIKLATKDLIYDRVTRKIYASVPGSAGPGGNSITPIDPMTGVIGAPVFIGSEPGRLALSDDGQYLYVALDGAAAVRRFDMATQMAGPQFALGSDSIFGPYYVEDMQVMPGNPHVVAISRMNLSVSPRHAGVAIYEDGVPRGKVTARHTGSNVIAFSASPNRLYGYNNETTEFGFRRMTVDASGVTVDDVTDDLISGFDVDIRYDQGLIFSTTGRVIDPEARTLLGTINGLGVRVLVAPDVQRGRVYYLVGDGPTRKLLIFDPKTFQLVGSRDIAGVMGKAGSLIRWGEDGFAFGTDQGQVFLIDLAHPGTPSAPPVLLSLTLNPDTARGETTVTGTVTLSAPAPAEGVTVQLSSVNPQRATVPPTVTVPAGATTASFPIIAQASSSSVDIPITATLAGAVQTATLHVAPGNPVLSAPVYNPANGHWYQEAQVAGAGIAWREAKAAAEALTYAGYRGHLATITSADENQFILTHVPHAADMGPYRWLGGYLELGRAWLWVTGEPWSYTNWHPNGPQSTAQVETGLVWLWDGTWTVAQVGSGLQGFIVEYEPPAPTPPSPPLPTGTAQLVLFPNQVPGGLLALGQVILAQPAGPGGVIVTLTSSSAVVVVPPTVSILPGANSVTFPVVTFPVAAPTPVTISAGSPGGGASATLLLLPMGAPPPTPPVNLLVNGSFEEPHGDRFGVSDGVPGWRILKGTIDILTASYWQAAPDGGNQSIDLDGTSVGTIEQSFATVPGQDYLFSGYVSHNPSVPYGRANVFLNGVFLTQLTHAIPNRNADMQWQRFSYRFRATAAATTLTLSDVTGINDTQGTVLDGLSVTPADAPSPASEPVILLSARMIINARIQLTWTDRSQSNAGFVVWRKSERSDFQQIAVLAPRTTGFVDTSIGPNTTYTYQVRSTGDMPSLQSNEASVTTPLQPAAPTGLRASQIGATQITLAWDANSDNALAMEVYRKSEGGDWVLVDVLSPDRRSFTNRGLSPGTRYTYRVRAANDYFASGWSNEALVMTLAGV